MFGVRALVERLGLFKRNKVPWNLKAGFGYVFSDLKRG